MWLSGLLVILVLNVSSEKVSYANYKVHRIIPQTDDQINALKDLEKTNVALSFWSDITWIGKPVDVMVGPFQKDTFDIFINETELYDEIYIENVQNYIDNQMPNRISSKFDFNEYHPLSKINAQLEEFAQTYPQVTLVDGGTSFEGRNITGVHVSYFPENKPKTIFIEGGIHACEWISPATVMYILQELLTSTDATVRQVAESYDWYIFPVYNPDGYEYTHSTDRLWRKTRQPHGDCVGADPNRNWGFHWSDGGSFNDSCSEKYSGPYEFSETETRTMSQFIASVQKDLVAYIGFHSYSQLLLIPYGHTSEHLDNYEQLMAIGEKVGTTLAQRYGTKYIVGNIVDILYVASGNSMDWVKGNFGTPITYTYELRDTGTYGYLLPADQILPTGEETFDSLIVMLQEWRKQNIH